MGKKRRMVLIASLVMGMTAGSVAAATLAGCKPRHETVIDNVTGVYYGEADGKECEIQLEGSSSGTFTFTYNGAQSQGEFTYDGTNLNLTFADSTIYTANLTKSGENNSYVLSINYANTAFELSVVNKYEVTFKDGNAVLETKSVVEGKTVKKPNAPSKSGYAFAGWYEDANFTKAFDFTSKTITGATDVYARFVAVDASKSVYVVKFYDGDTKAAEAVKTVNGVVYDLPTLTKSGSTFAGWWVSDYEDASKLTYKYEGQELKQNTTLFAVWESNAPLVSVTSTGIKWTAKGVANSYIVTVKKPDGTVENLGTVGTTSFNYDFISKEAGDYEISVTLRGNTTVAYYSNGGLARVSIFTVEGNVLKFEGVEKAETYLITVDCGNKDHNHTDLDLHGATQYDFSSCVMQKGGIKFIVKACAAGMATSQSEAFVVERNLEKVQNLKIDSSTEVVKWDAVANATSYVVEVTQNGKTDKYTASNSNEGYSIKYYTGAMQISVYPVADGYNSPDKTEIAYTKNSLATPQGIKFSGYVVSWDAVANANEGYTVKINGTTYDVKEGTSYDISSIVAGQSQVTFAVRAAGSHASVYSDEITFHTTLNSAEYKSGKVSWNAVLGATKYGIQVGDAEEITVEDGSLSKDIKFTAGGENSIKIAAYNQNDQIIGSQYEIKVNVHTITFDANGGNAVEALYLATGDELVLPNAIYAGYNLDGWYDVAGGAAAAGKKIENGTFRGASDVTYYAYWIGKEFTAKLHVGIGATVDIDSATVSFGKDYSLPIPKNTDSSLAFAGWYTMENGRGENFTDEYGKSVINWNKYGDTDLYAYWINIYSFYLLNDDTYSVRKGSQTSLSSITEITIPSMYKGKLVSTVEGAAFQSCSNLVRINIPNTIRLVQMGSAGGYDAGSAFQSCSKLEEVNVYEVEGYTGEVVYESKDGVLIYHREVTGETEIVYYPYAKTDDYIIPDGVTYLPINVFNKCKFKKITIPTSVTYISDLAFSNASNLTEVVFAAPKAGEQVQSLTLGSKVFKSCIKLEKVTFPARLAKVSHEVEENGNTKIVEHDFYDVFASCGKLTDVFVEGTGTEYSYSSDGVILSADGKTLIYCPLGKEGPYTIPTGVTAVGSRAFYNCTKLNSVKIPAFVTEIKEEAFMLCTNVRMFIFEGTDRDGDLAIRERAFYKCTNTGFTSVVLPENLTVLEDNAFGYCTYLTTVTVNCTRSSEQMQYSSSAFNRVAADVSGSSNATVTTVNLGANVNKFAVKGVFGGTGSRLTNVNVDPANQYYYAVNGVLFDKGVTEILFYPINRSDKTYNIPSTVTKISDSVFAEVKALKNITIDTNIVEISDKAFSGCTNLTEVKFTENRTENLTIGNGVFENCTELEKVVFPEKTTSIGSGAFVGCVNLQSEDLPASFATWGTANDVASVFVGCPNFANINVATGNSNFASADGVLCGVQNGKTVSVLYSPVCNSGDENKTVTLPSTITSVAASAFSGNAYIEKIKFTDSETVVPVTIGEKAFYKSTALKEVHLPVGLKTIEKLSFYNCTALQKVNIPYTVEKIDAAAFAWCTDLDTVSFDNTPTGKTEVKLTITNGTTNYTTIPAPTSSSPTGYLANEPKQGVFAKCTSLESITLPGRLTTIGNYTFTYAGLKTVTLSEGVTTIGTYAFQYNSDLISVDIPSTVTKVDNYAFYKCTTMQTAVFATSASNVTIGQSAFQDCDLRANAVNDGKTTGLVLPTKLTTVGKSAFNGNKNLTAIGLENTTVTSIGETAFAKCSALSTVTIPSTCELGKNAFQDCTGLISVTLNGKLAAAGYVFNGCSGLTTITLPNTLTSIPTYTFQKCTSLNNVVIPESVKTIEASAFSGCSGLDTITFSSVLTDIKNSAFQNCGFSSIIIPASVKTIGRSAFAGCESLSTVTFATKEVEVKTKGENDEEVTVKEQQSDLNVIEQEAFSKTALTAFTFPISTDVKGIKLGTTSGSTTTVKIFNGCKELKTVHLSRSVTDVTQLFEGCYSIQTISIAPDSGSISTSSSVMPGASIVFDIKGTVIQYVVGVALDTPGTYTIPEGITGIATYAFKNQNNIRSLVLPSTLEYIGDFAFQNCRMLKSVKFNVGATGSANEGTTSLTTIGQYAFDSCYSLNTMTVGSGTVNTLPNTAATLGNYVFYHCGFETFTVPNVNYVTIGSNIFNQNTSLKTVYHLSTKFGNAMYSYCANLKTVYLNSSLTEIMQFKSGSTQTEVARFIFQGDYALDTVKLYNTTTKEVQGEDGVVTVPAGLTQINANFFQTTSVKKVDLSLVTSDNFILDTNSFEACPQLTEIVAPEKIKKVGNYAFRGCGFETLSLPECTVLGGYSFSGCTSLTEISIPKCADIQSTAFGWTTSATINGKTYDFLACTSLRKVVLSSDESVEVKIGNNAFGFSISTTAAASTFNEEMYTLKSLSSLEEINLERVVSLGDCAFAGATFVSVSLPNCTTIGNFAFSGCRQLEKVSLSTTENVTLGNYVFGYYKDFLEAPKLKEINLEKVTSVGEYCFYNCTALQGKKVAEGKYVLDLSECETLYNYAFAYCTALTDLTLNSIVDYKNTIKLPNNDPSGYYFAYCDNLTTVNGIIKNVGRLEFEKCYSLLNIDLSQATTIGYGAFEYCEALESIDLSSVEFVDEWAFNRCVKLTDVILGSKLESISKRAFSQCAKLENINLSNVKSIGEHAFSYDVALSGSLELTSIFTIGADAFRGCENIEGLVLSDTLKRIYERAFYNCEKLTAFEVPDSLTYIGDYSFYNTAFEGELNLNGVYDVGTYAFAMTDVEKVIIKDFLYNIGAGAFGQCAKLEGFEVSESNPWFIADGDGVLYAKVPEGSNRTLICYPSAKSGTFEITEDLTVAPHAFAGCYDLIVTVSGDSEVLKDGALGGYCGGDKYTVPANITDIDDDAFRGAGISEIVLPEGLQTIGKNAFRDSDVTTIVIPEGVKEIGDYAFAGCKSLVSIEIPASVTKISPHTFDGCTSLKTVVMHQGLQTIGTDAFYGCSALASITIPDGVQLVEAYAFEDSGVVDVVFGENVGTIGEYAFTNCLKLETVTFGDGLGIISDRAFGGKDVNNSTGSCVNLTSLTFEGSVKEIGQFAFAYTGVAEVVIPEDVEALKYYAFGFCTELKKVTIKGDIGTYADGGELKSGIGNCVFRGCTAITEIIIEEGVTLIGWDCFEACGTDEGMTVSLPSTLKKIDDYAFQDSGITEFVATVGLKDIGDSMFNGCKRLANVVLPEGLTSIGYKMFQGCTALTSVTIPSTIESWNDSTGFNTADTGNYAFADSGITSVTFTEGLVRIGAYAFTNTKITEINYPASLKSIGRFAFQSCTGLTKAVIPDNLEIGNNDWGFFADCVNITEVEFGAGFTRLCSDLFNNCTKIETIIIPAGVTYVAGAFKGWTSEQTIIFTTTDGLETAVPNDSSYFISGWLFYCGAKIVYQTPSSPYKPDSAD